MKQINDNLSNIKCAKNGFQHILNWSKDVQVQLDYGCLKNIFCC